MARATLLDTSVLSEMMRIKPEARVADFLGRTVNVIVAAVTFHELVYGAARLEAGARKAAIVARIDLLRKQFAERIVAIDREVAELSGELRAGAAARGFVLEPMDSMIAACAASRGAVLATRNTRHFAPLGILLADPWSA